MLTTGAGECVMLWRSPPRRAHHRSTDSRIRTSRSTTRSSATAEYKTGLLKRRIPCSVLHFGGVAHAPSMMAARDELLRARDAGSRVAGL